MNNLREEYFNWMYQLVCDGTYNPNSYRRLLDILDRREFVYKLPMDGNRYEDGTDLRYRFGYENDLDGAVIATELDCKPCSILEMMVALAIRCEEHIMDNPDIGNRTGRWFMDMIESLGLSDMTDDGIDEDYVNGALDRFLERDYERDGRGGLFTIRGCDQDMRKVEIWYQLMWYLDSAYG